MIIVIIIICVIVALYLLSAYFIQDYPAWRRHTEGKNNRIYSSDGMFATYVYKVSLAKEDVIERLCHKNVADKLCYEFDKDTLQIRFANPEIELYNVKNIGDIYQLRFEEKDGTFLLYVEQIKKSLSTSTSRVPVLMNTFWVEKIGAEFICMP